MIEIKNISIPTKPSEFTLEQFETVTNIINSNGDTFEKYISVLSALGLSNKLIDDLDETEFFDFITELNKKQDFSDELVKSIEIDGYTYQAYDDEFKLKVKDLTLIEKLLKKNSKEFISSAMAIIFKRTDLTSTEHYIEAHVDYKKKLFRNINVSIFLPYIVHIVNNIKLKLNLLNG